MFPPYQLITSHKDGNWGWAVYRLVEYGESKSKRKADRSSTMAMFYDFAADKTTAPLRELIKVAFRKIEVKTAMALLKRLGFDDAEEFHKFCGLKG